MNKVPFTDRSSARAFKRKCEKKYWKKFQVYKFWDYFYLTTKRKKNEFYSKKTKIISLVRKKLYPIYKTNLR